MLSNKLGLQIDAYSSMRGLEINIFDVRTPNGLFIASPVELRFEKVVEGCEQLRPTILIPRGQYFMAQELVAALTGAGVDLPDKGELKGRLEAMDNHLQDMRKLLKLTK